MFGLARLARLDLDERLDEVGLGSRRAKGSASKRSERVRVRRDGRYESAAAVLAQHMDVEVLS
jgi:hypothetical protein